MAKDRLGWALALGGLAIGIGGAIYLARNQGKASLFGGGLGRLFPGKGARPPLVGETTGGGMKMSHYRSNNMPIEERVRLIQDRVWGEKGGVRDPRMRKLALQITKHCPERDGTCEARAVYNYIKQHVRYTGDVAPVAMGAGGPVEAIDLFQSAPRTLEFGGGDCDDNVILGSVLLAHNGITPRIRVTSEALLGEYSHVYALAGLPKLDPQKWVAIDTTLPGNRNFGVEAPYKRHLDFDA